MHLLTTIMKALKFFILAGLVALISCTGEKYDVSQVTDSNGYTYEIVSNDPTGLRIYTLENGLKVYLSVNKIEPRIMTFIAIRAGSNNDPIENTGLAHYFEHLMFKGTSTFGTANWEKEEPMLDSISTLFELACQKAIALNDSESIS
jgi:zinc protease